jgi:hypothetical protein
MIPVVKDCHNCEHADNSSELMPCFDCAHTGHSTMSPLRWQERRRRNSPLKQPEKINEHLAEKYSR